MEAIDTNILVRYLVEDDPEQSARASGLIDRRPVFVGTAVVLECEWVLRSVFGFSRSEVNEALRAITGLPNLTIENPSLVTEAIGLAELGVDFADALHLGAASGCDALLTFDRDFIKIAGRVTAHVPVKEP